MSVAGQRVVLVVPDDGSGMRLDAFLATRGGLGGLGLSRARVAGLIKEGAVLLNGGKCKPASKVKAGDVVSLVIPPVEEPRVSPEPIPVKIVYEDGDVLVVNKPRGMVTHPGAGVSSGTLVNALLFHAGGLSGIGGVIRPGIVHRLDKNTSGLLVVAKNDEAHRALASQLKTREMKRIYLALVHGEPKEERFTVDAPIGRHPVHRKKMAVVREGGKRAVSHFEVLRRYGGYSLLECSLETGRTHQIRVHLSHAGYPVVGDDVYGRRKEELPGAPRHALHAAEIRFHHPGTGEPMRFCAPLPEDMKTFIDVLEGFLPRLECGRSGRKGCGDS